MAESDRRIAEAFAREGARLRGFIRRRVPGADDVEDVLQDVFSDLVEALRLPRPIEHLSAWLYQVTRRRIADRFRRGGRVASVAEADGEHADGAADAPASPDEAGAASLEDLLPSPEAGP